MEVHNEDPPRGGDKRRRQPCSGSGARLKRKCGCVRFRVSWLPRRATKSPKRFRNSRGNSENLTLFRFLIGCEKAGGESQNSDITRAKGRLCNLMMYRCSKSSTSTTFSANQTIPQRLTVAGVPCPMSRTSNMTRILGSSSNRSPLGSVKVLLSSRTEFKLSTQSGSKSPSKTIQCLCDGADDADMRRRIAVKMPSLHSRVFMSSLPAEQLSCTYEYYKQKYRKDLPS